MRVGEGLVHLTTLKSGQSETVEGGNRAVVVGNCPPETAIVLPSSLRPGTCDLRVTLLDEPSGARIQLGIAGRDDLGRYRLGELRIK